MSKNEIIHRIALGILLLFICSISFRLGYTNAIKESQERSDVKCLHSDSPDEMSRFRQDVHARLKVELGRLPRSFSSPSESKDSSQFPRMMRNFAAGALRVSRDDILKEYDFGVPLKKVLDEDVDAMILYNSQSSLPSDQKLRDAAANGVKNDDGPIAKVTVSQAMEKCDTLNTVFLPLRAPHAPGLNECYALIGSFESYHINRWMRMPIFTDYNTKERQLNKDLTLRHVGRITLAKGVDEFTPPELWKKGQKGFLLKHFDSLKIFLKNVDSVLKDLKKLLQKRDVVKNNTVIVLTVNKGQSELLTNFVCSARSRGFDVGNILVFPTDLESKALSEGLGVATYFDEKNLGTLPSGEAKVYGDPIFAAMMYAKVLCVLYVSLLGHDVLFSDVDVVWFRDPLTYFHDESNRDIQKFDILFQHDGSSQPRYNPFSANSGFYYVRANKKTQYLFTSLLYDGGLIRKSKSHQQVLVQLLNEHSSMFGLNVKVFDKIETSMFPGGYHYHLDWDTMRAIFNGESDAFIMHMSWTENKDNKLLFFRQMGEWYVDNKCIGEEMIDRFSSDIEAKDGELIGPCCSATAIFSCHFSDKPSKLPCRESPKMDKRGKPFWP
mmetsp:Transcript_1784/g.3441  ORF Transcript_1784/g.3441 Transcript_1784/m.3441 type:complete len:608 (-) Transcript_1784:88-1911(-)